MARAGLGLMRRLFQQGQNMLKEAIENLKIATRRYAKRQRKWVNNRLLRRADRQVPPVYSLDCSDVEQWESEVYGKAIEIVSAVLHGKTPNQQPMNSVIENAKVTDSSNSERHFCEDCQKILISEIQWNEHMKGNKHRKKVQKIKRELEIQQQESENDTKTCRQEEKSV